MKWNIKLLASTLLNRFMEETEFFEGVRCQLIDRGDKPKWMYNHVLDID